MKSNKILVVFPDGVGIRNYLYSDVFDHDRENVVLFHNFTTETIEYLTNLRGISDHVEIPNYEESVAEKYLRELISLSRLKYNAKRLKNPTILQSWKNNHKGISKNTFYKIVTMASRFKSSYKAILRLEEKYARAIRQNPFYGEITTILKRLQPKSVFCTHQRGLKMATIFAAAQDLGIPTTTVIYSWDNIPKARLALKADTYAVWSPYMRDELQFYYPEIEPDKIVVTGTPQFDFYRNRANIIEKSLFYSSNDLDPGRKIICFSGDDVHTSPDDPQYLADLAAALVSHKLTDRFQILFRRCPVDFSGRYDDVVLKYNGLIKEVHPSWNATRSGRWTDVFPLYDDVSLLVSTCYYSDVVVNIGSTMALDFAQFNKPCLYINYDQPVKNNPEWSVDKIYQFQHFRSMDGIDAVGWINSRNDIGKMITKAIDRPDEVGPERHLWLNKIVAGRVSFKF